MATLPARLAPLGSPADHRQRSVPDSTEAEQAVLGALLIDAEAWGQVSPHVKAEDFAVAAHRHVFEACEALAKDGRPIDPVLVNVQLDARGQLGTAVPSELAFGLARGLGTAANVAHYAKEVSRLRSLRAGEPPDPLEGLSVGHFRAGEERRIEEGVERVSTGWVALDTAIGGGFAIPSLNILGAAPKSGKSTWAQHTATRWVEAGGCVYYLDMENGRRRFLRQLLCRKSLVGPSKVAAALRDPGAGVFATSRDAFAWREAKTWLREELGPRFFAEFIPPRDFAARVRAVRRAAGDRRLLVVVDSLQKLPGDLDDRRAVVDGWVRLFERLRHELDLAFLVISEIKRNGKGEYQASESAFKESGGIEYAADLAMTLTRPRADEDEEPLSTLRVELARDCDEDPRGDVASYRPVFPHYGLEEGPPQAHREAKKRGPAAEKAEAAIAFLATRLEAGPVTVAELVRDGKDVGYSRATLYRAKDHLRLLPCTLKLQNAWRLP